VPTVKTNTTRYFSIDADHDISGDVLSLSLDQATWVAATYVGAPSARLTSAKPAVVTGMTRYWWSMLMGSAGGLVPDVGTDTVFGKLVDGSQTLIYDWPITSPY
jgi:hypothetical protein